MLKTPRFLLLGQFHDWDWHEPLPETDLKQVRDSYYVLLSLFAEQCGFWDGTRDYTSSVSGQDEGAIIFTYDCLLLLIVTGCLGLFLVWTLPTK